MRLRAWAGPAILLLATLGLFGRSASFAFVDFDDNVNVIGNPHLAQPFATAVKEIWGAPYQGLYIPVTYTAWAAVAGIAKSVTYRDPTELPTPFDPAPFHLFNLLLHAINVLLVYWFLVRLTGRSDWPAFAGAAVFALHPLQVETVAWVTGAKELLSTMFALLGLVAMSFATERQSLVRRSATLALSLALCLVALFAKPATVMVPVAGLALCWRRLAMPRRQLAGVACIWLAACAALTWVTMHAQEAPDVPILARILAASDAVGFYFKKLLVPMNLSFLYERTPWEVMDGAWRQGLWLLPLGITAALAALRPTLLRAYGFILLLLLPVVGLIPFAYQTFSTVADRYFYLPMVGVALAIAMALPKRPAALAMVGAGCVLLCQLTWRQLDYWRDTLALGERIVLVNPDSVPGHERLGRAYFRLRRYDDAAQHFERRVAINSNDSFSHSFLATYYASSGDFGRAWPHAAEALRLTCAEKLPAGGANLMDLRLPPESAVDWSGAVREIAAGRCLTGAELIIQGADPGTGASAGLKQRYDVAMSLVTTMHR